MGLFALAAPAVCSAGTWFLAGLGCGGGVDSGVARPVPVFTTSERVAVASVALDQSELVLGIARLTLELATMEIPRRRDPVACSGGGSISLESFPGELTPTLRATYSDCFADTLRGTLDGNLEIALERVCWEDCAEPGLELEWRVVSTGLEVVGDRATRVLDGSLRVAARFPVRGLSPTNMAFVESRITGSSFGSRLFGFEETILEGTFQQRWDVVSGDVELSLSATLDSEALGGLVRLTTTAPLAGHKTDDRPRSGEVLLQSGAARLTPAGLESRTSERVMPWPELEAEPLFALPPGFGFAVLSSP